jgi:hypothetical protein
MNITDMTRKDFESLGHRKWDETVTCESIVILPTRHMHDSGYRCMDFVAIKGNEALCLLSGCSDVIHVDGIGGFGHDWLNNYGRVPISIPISGWSIDCLPKSGLLRMWPSNKKKVLCEPAYSSFEIFAVDA